MTGSETVRIGGIPFMPIGLEAACDRALAAASGEAVSAPQTFRFANAWCVVSAAEDPSYRAVLCGPGVNFADGRPIARRLESATSQTGLQVRGIAFLERVLQEGTPLGVKHYFYGASAKTLAHLAAQLELRFPGASVVGMESPPYASKEELAAATVAERIAATEPNIIWVGLGTPKQDFVALELAKRTGVTTAAVGAAFDFLAGTVREAPVWVRRAGLEWAFRLVLEPRRLWRRYLIGNAKFLRIVSAERRR